VRGEGRHHPFALLYRAERQPAGQLLVAPAEQHRVEDRSSGCSSDRAAAANDEPASAGPVPSPTHSPHPSLRESRI
jgi:hypothetical protein